MENRMTRKQKKFLLKLISLFINTKWEDGWKDFQGNQYKNVEYDINEYRNNAMYNCIAKIFLYECKSMNIKMKEFSQDYFSKDGDFFTTKEPVNYDDKKKKWYLSNDSKLYQKIIRKKISKSSASRLIFSLKKYLNI